MKETHGDLQKGLPVLHVNHMCKKLIKQHYMQSRLSRGGRRARARPRALRPLRVRAPEGERGVPPRGALPRASVPPAAREGPTFFQKFAKLCKS